jgi:hypothetical protein
MPVPGCEGVVGRRSFPPPETFEGMGTLRALIAKIQGLGWVVTRTPTVNEHQRDCGRNSSSAATMAPCKERGASVYVVGMPNKPPKRTELSKVIPLTEEKHRVIASDPPSHRMIFAIGQQRYAFDFFTRITHLPPHTGDQPATILPMKGKKCGDQEKAKKVTRRLGP